jgi:hypothetical protein
VLEVSEDNGTAIKALEEAGPYRLSSVAPLRVAHFGESVGGAPLLDVLVIHADIRCIGTGVLKEVNGGVTMVKCSICGKPIAEQHKGMPPQSVTIYNTIGREVGEAHYSCARESGMEERL